MVGARIIGSVLIDVEIDAYVKNLTVNGVDVVPLVEAELDRLHPERVALRPTDVAGAIAALDVVDAFWEPTLARVRGPARGAAARAGRRRVVDRGDPAPPALRVRRVVRPGGPRRGIAVPPARPAGVVHAPRVRAGRRICGRDLEDVLAARQARQDQVREHLATLDDDGLRRPVPTHGIGGFPPEEERSTLDCLRVILNEEWAHHRFAVRDLDVLDPRAQPEAGPRTGRTRGRPGRSSPGRRPAAGAPPRGRRPRARTQHLRRGRARRCRGGSASAARRGPAARRAG